jgi:SAM-dependent methyltransferase
MISYADFHRKRYDVLLHYCNRYIPDRQSSVLEVGASSFTAELARRFEHLDVLGLDKHRSHFCELAVSDDHYIIFDLNRALFPELTIDLKQYDAIVFAEVIEHLFCPPEVSLGFLRNALRPGGVLICQTPNGLSLEKRLRMLLGNPPFDRKTSCHYREFSKNELFEAAQRAGLEVLQHEFRDYFGVRGGAIKQVAGAAIHGIGFLLPHLRRGQTIVYRRPLE